MQYLLSVHMDNNDFVPPSQEAIEKMYADVGAFNEEIKASGAWVFAGGLQGVETASTVDATKGAVTVTEGPRSNSGLQLGGFWIVDVADEKTARELAAKGSAACQGAVEVRAFQDLPEA